MFHLEVRLKKTRPSLHFIVKMIILPRQARDKQRENSKRDAFSDRIPRRRRLPTACTATRFGARRITAERPRRSGA